MRDRVFELIEKEKKRQRSQIHLISSENFVSENVLKALGSCLTNKYAEGYAGRRYYQGNKIIDEIESLCIERAKELFGVEHVNVQPLSGAPANLAILMALTKNGDCQLSQLLSHGGHLSMGQEVSVTRRLCKAIHYHLTEDGEVNWQELEDLAKKYKPKIIWSGGTAYTKIFDWKKYTEIANEIGAYFVADISHIGGLVAGGAHPSPVVFADVIMTTTHKTLRGPRGAMIMVTKKGLEKDIELAKKIDKAVFPGVQGGPHMETVTALAVALGEAKKDSFKDYSKEVVVNAKRMAEELRKRDYKLIGGGSENHMVWIDLRNKSVDGWMAAWGLEFGGIITNRQTIPFDPKSPYYPSGLRVGTPAVTSLGMKEEDMKKIVMWIDRVVEKVKSDERWKKIGQVERDEDQRLRRKFKELMKDDEVLVGVRKEVEGFLKKFVV